MNHHVSIVNGWLYKSSVNRSGNSNLLIEHNANMLLGRDSHLHKSSGTVQLATPVIGDATNVEQETEHLTESTVDDMMRYIRHVYNTTPIPHTTVVPTMSDCMEAIKRRLKYRVQRHLTPDYVVRSIPRLSRYNYTQRGLTHHDPRPSNWVRDDEGNLALVDWESAMIAPWEYTVATFVTHLIEYGDPRFTSQVCAWSQNQPLLYSMLTVRRAEVVSWWYAHVNATAGAAWYDHLTTTLELT